MISFALAALVLLWNASSAHSTQVFPQTAETVVSHADLNGNQHHELILALPDSCDENGVCLLTVQQILPTGVNVLLPPTRMWDLSPSSDTKARRENGWIDLVEARREGPNLDDISIVIWRFDGKEYRRLDETLKLLPSTPEGLS